MRILATALLGIFLSFEAFAFPQLGSSATYEVQTTTDQGVSVSTQTQTLVEYDSATDQYKVEIVETLPDGSQSTEHEWQKAKDIASEALLKHFLEKCVEQGGELQTIQVPAGSFETCFKTHDGILFWVGVVPFALARFEMDWLGAHVVGELKSYQD